MNIDTQKANPVSRIPADLDMDDFDFKPITSGLGFHQPKVTEVKPAFIETPVPKPVVTRKAAQPSSNVYQNDLSLFYGHQQPVSKKTERMEKIAPAPAKVAGKVERTAAYILDLAVVGSLLALTLTAMARAMEMDLIEAWMAFPHDMTPLVLILFCGFYLIYFSVFEKTSSSTLGKNLFSLKVISSEEEQLSFSTLLLRSLISMLNFISLGLFSWYDLQNKITQSKVVRVR